MDLSKDKQLKHGQNSYKEIILKASPEMSISAKQIMKKIQKNISITTNNNLR